MNIPRMSSARPKEQSGPRTIPPLGGAEKYRDIAELGSGGMGEVYLSVAKASGLEGFNKLLVVKRIRQSFADDDDVLKMFLNEARLAARLMHPNVVQTNEVGFDGQRHYIAMEYLDGQSLLSVLRRARELKVRFPLDMHLRVITEALAGLHYAHELGDFDGTPLNIVHRDATPHNVFVTYDGQVKIVDFGIAKVGQSGDTRTGVFKGKIPYMAPEQVTQGAIDRRCDIFAVGVMLWEAVAQRRMWKGASDVQIMLGLHNGELARLSEFAPNAPPALVSIVERALSLKIEERYATAGAMQADLESYLRSFGAPPSARDVGRWVSDAFADARKQIRAAIETQLKTINEQPSALLVKPLEELTGPAGDGTPPHIDGTPSDLRRSMSTLSAPSVSAASLTDTRTQVRSGNTGIFIGVAAACLLLGGAAAYFATRSAGDPPPSTQPTTGESTAATAKASANAEATTKIAAATTAPAPLPAATPTTNEIVVVEVTTTPPDAKVFLDDATLTGTTAKYPKDGMSHRLRVEAPGYLPQSQWVTFDGKPITLNVKLDRVPFAYGKPIVTVTAPTVPAIASAKPPAATTTTTFGELDKPPPKAPPKSSIDTSDPFK